MPQKHFTDRWARTVQTKDKQEEFYDSGFKLRGISFGLKLSNVGGRDYFIRFRNRAGKRRYLTLGNALSMTLAKAHKEAARFKSEIDSGNDPTQKKHDLKTAPTVQKLAELYYTREAVNRQRPKTYLERKRIIDVDIIPAIGDLKASDVTRRDIIALLESIEHEKEAPIMASRVRTVLFSIFRYGVDRELVPHNPCIHLPRMIQTRARDRALSEDEIKKLWKSLEAIPYSLASFYKMLLVLAQRVNETAGMQWNEIEGNKWHLPAERAKNGKAHLIPLSPLALKILKEIKRNNAKLKKNSRLKEKEFFDIFVFPSGRAKGAMQNVSKRFRSVVEKLTVEDKMPHCTMHDLRRTAASHMRKLSIAAETVEKILNHAPRSILGRHYDKYQAEKEKRDALALWGQDIERIISGKRKGKVIPLQQVNQ